MLFSLTRKQVARLFEGGENGLATKIREGCSVLMQRGPDPERGQATLEFSNLDIEKPFVLMGEGQVFEELLDSIGIVFVPRRVVEILVGDVAIVKAYTDPDSKLHARFSDLTIEVEDYGAILLEVCDGKLYIELPDDDE